jgi:hypothetical protein
LAAPNTPRACHFHGPPACFYEPADDEPGDGASAGSPNGSDKIDMRGTGITPANVAQNVTLTECAEGSVLVSFGTSEVWLAGVMPGNITFADDFIFDASAGNNAPTNATLSGGSVAENAANGTSVGTVTGFDPDAGAVLGYSLTDNAGGRFAINATTGQITVANGTLLNYEAATSHAVTVRVTDQGGLTFDKVFTLAITEVADGANQAPTGATLTGGSIAENAANGTSVGPVTGIDPDAGAVLSYTLADNASGRFAISGAKRPFII